MKRKLGRILLIISLVVNLLLVGKIMIDSSETELSYAISEYQGSPEEELIDVINKAQEELNIAIYNLDNENIVDALSAASGRGVSIKIIADGENTENKDSKKIFDELEALNIPVKINTNEKMHIKLTISDNETVVTGSFNYTKDSAEDNQEVLLTVSDADFATAMNDTFNEMWDSGDLEEW